MAKIGAFRFWCQKVLPLVYDDSISYYELLNKMVVYLNNVISDFNTVAENFDNLDDAFDTLQGSYNDTKNAMLSAYDRLQSYVNNYFDNLDVQEEINNKLDEMAEDGSLSELLEPFITAQISSDVAAWLQQHITPTSPAVDSSLTVSGAAADAKVTGDKIEDLKADLSNISEDLSNISEETRNMFSGEIGVTNGIAWDSGTLTNTSADGRTQFYCVIRFRNDASNVVASTVKIISASARYAITLTPTSDGDNIQIVHNGSRTNLTASLLCNFEANKTYTVSFNVDGYNPSVVGGLDISKIQIELGDTATEYIGHITAYDQVARTDSAQAVEKTNAIGDKIEDLKADLSNISEETRNLFSGEIGVTNGIAWDSGTLTNTSADGRTQFYCVIRFRNDASNVVASTVKVISASARYAITLTPTSDGDNIQIVHNGSRTNLTASLLCNFEANKTYTVSFNVDGYNPSVVGGLDISKIQIELGDTATEYIGHTTAYDAVARTDSTQAAEKSNAISAISPNLFDGTISAFSNLEKTGDKIENTDTDTRESFYFTVRYLDGSTLKDTSPTTPINFAGRVAQTLTATANCTAIQVMHNGRQRNMSFTMPFAISSGETYTVSLNVESYNVGIVGGLVLSDIQIELGNKETAYIPNKYTAVDYIARNAINARTPEAKLNVLLMGDSIFGNDGEIALFLDQMCNSCVNGAFGGTRVAARPSSNAFYAFDGVNIITALCNQTWTEQDASAESLASSYPWITARLAGLKAVDMSKIDLLVMDWGTNDYTAGATIEDITTAYNMVIDLLQTTYPKLRILITTPIWRYWGTEADNENGDNKVYNVSTLKEIALAIEDFMKDKRISVLNAYQNLPLSYKTALTYFDANDKTHLNTFGNKVYAYLLHGKIRSIY